ncbi:mechanosensitive ion channel family protein [Bacillus sp. V5-8f]|uniref:mechanosensitive ion channel family protein n=1 Tax=Bacillus sp. V5-8f TaxID=2053044 RepID=UPI000C75A2A0|nr:mechanosensitive ion channel domain-containing protein [Bacillus sp. V5-8f]PLT33064.1 mechanosensitive ion channel protein MscS [Bacillus sp. V5-8f]
MFNFPSVHHFLWFVLYLLLIIIGNFLLKWLLTTRTKKEPEFKRRFYHSLSSWLGWITFYSIIVLFLFYFSKEEWMFHPLYTQGDIDVSVFLILVVILIVSLVHKLIKIVTQRLLNPFYKYYGVDQGMGYTINQIIYYIVMITALGISFTTVGVDLTALGAIFGVLGIGIGFGMRNITGNFVSGIIILFERPVEVGEVIQVNDKVGRVEKIRLRSTVVKTAKEGTLIVPNQYFIENIIKNRTGAKMMAQVKVSVEYGIDTERIDDILSQAVTQVKDSSYGILDDPEADIRFIDFRNHAMDFLVEIPVVDFEIKEQIESKLRHAISHLFLQEKIKLAPYGMQPILYSENHKLEHKGDSG